MDSLEEKDKPAPKLSKHPRIEVDEELMRQMIAGQAPLDSKVVRRIPEPEEGAEETAQEPVPKSEVDESSPSVVPAAVAAGKDAFGFRRKKLTLPDFERTFFAPVDCRNRSAIYVQSVGNPPLAGRRHNKAYIAGRQYVALCHEHLQRRTELSPREEE